MEAGTKSFRRCATPVARLRERSARSAPGEGRGNRIAYLLISPSLLFVLLLFLIPLVQTIVPVFETGLGLGLAKFQQMATALDFITAIKDTFALVVVAPLQLAAAIGMAPRLPRTRFS
jgi:ABC-type sugar transport system permease subunit